MSNSSDQVVFPAINPYQPGAYSTVDASNFDGQGITQGRTVAVIGTTLGGVPLQALSFRGPGPMRQALRGGPAYDVARFAFAAGASRVCIVRVGNSPTPSTLTLMGANAAAVTTLTSLDYGSWTTNIKVVVAANNAVTIAYTDGLGVTYTETYALGSTATPAQLVAAINGTLYGFNKSNYVSASAPSTGTMPLATITSTPLAGGSDGLTPVAGDWSNGLKVLETQDVNIIVPATGDATIHALALAHANAMSQPIARAERTVVAGGVLGESPTTAAARMTGSLQDKRLELVYPGTVDFDGNGNLVTYDPFYMAGKLAGMWAGNTDTAQSLIHRRVPTIDVERRLSTMQGSDVDLLLAAGITPIAPAPGTGFWVVDSVSGYAAPDGVFRDFHKVRSADYCARVLRQRLEDRFIGKKSLAGSSDAIGKFSDKIAADLLSQQVIRAAQPTVVTPGPDTRTYMVSVPVMLVDAIKFIFITVALQPSSTVNRDVGASAPDALQ